MGNLLPVQRYGLEYPDGVLAMGELSPHSEFETIPGIAGVAIFGQRDRNIRIWRHGDALRARKLSAVDVLNALRREHVELPAGAIEGERLQYSVRTDAEFRNIEELEGMVVANVDGAPVHLRDVARVERGTEDDRSFFRGNGVPQVGLGVVRQSTANLLDVARLAKREIEILGPGLPEGMEFRMSYDSSVFVEGAVTEVYSTLIIAVGLVVLAIFLFLGSVRAMLVPAVTVPVCLIATFIPLYALGFSVNLLTLLALVLAIG